MVPFYSGPNWLLLLGCFLASGCYLGSARSTTPAELAGEGGWEVVEAVPDIRQETRQDCGAAALAMVLRHWGRPATGDAILATSPHAPERGIKAAALREFARRQGMQAFLIQSQQNDLDREIHRHRPVLVGMMKRYFFRNYPHYEVVVGINRKKQRILTLDPAHGLRVNGQEGFATEWARAGNLALIVFPKPPDSPVGADTGQ